ncbi:MAG: AMP-binding protein [Lachnospiraceae bacterium]|nr:AMP-binding protein [Lachnospiraceae bacterium]
METILLTGATGFLGTELAARLLAMPVSVKLYALVRASDDEEAAFRLRQAWYHDKNLFDAVGRQVVPIPGDFTVSRLGLPRALCQTLWNETTLALHAGAEIGFQKNRRALDATNVHGTRQMLSFASKMKRLRRFVHISTAYVAGQQNGAILEDAPMGTTFSSLYEKSKAQAERLVRASSLPFSICRPGMIVGRSDNGWIKSFNTIYYILKLLLLGKLPVLPIRPETPLNIVPVDYVADAVARIGFSEDALGKTFHLTCPKDAVPQAGELVRYVRHWAKRHLSVRLPRPVFAPVPSLKQVGLLYNRKETNRHKNFLTNFLTLLPYFYGGQDFDRTNTDELLGSYPLRWQDFIDPLLTFACRKNFMRQTGQTVFEQARVRRASQRYPITYYDMTADGIHKRSGSEVNRRIDDIVDALWAWGVRKGDRIALTGINSVDYMTLEHAIGLLGAVSVPIYYTTPAPETALLLRQSGASWYFIGDKRMMAQVDLLETSARMVSFSEAQTVRNPGVMRWETFLDKADAPAPPQHPDPLNLATIRYTSGTTGNPKGVMFCFGQLAWMGEAMAGLLDWKERNQSLRYLSFLPLSHVVEGILAAYAPYYLLARVDYYYLHSFDTLSAALPRVRPTVFFSVPRFYEKLWEQIASSRPGKIWLHANKGVLRQSLAVPLRKAALCKAGLDACGQLIVGSAPIQKALLLRFRALGIEIHNAYGQTEAPLIAINRPGDNIIPTIGTPLPETTVTRATGGELIVTGPQVAMGYYGMETDAIQNGVLKTGDLGILHRNGHITLRGRKKELIVTAYGKNISIPKLEERLKSIPGVFEAVLIGENRPYCTALLWLDREIADLDAEVTRINHTLSHPEQIRRYRVISRPLGISDGELTPNLKVKRANVEAHFAQEIEEMYR